MAAEPNIVIASDAKQSMVPRRRNALRRGACHRARIRATVGSSQERRMHVHIPAAWVSRQPKIRVCVPDL